MFFDALDLLYTSAFVSFCGRWLTYCTLGMAQLSDAFKLPTVHIFSASEATHTNSVT